MKSLIYITIFFLIIFEQTKIQSQISETSCASGDSPPTTFGIPHRTAVQ